jgi:hypothetical protein
MTLLLSVTPRDGVPGVRVLDGGELAALAGRYEEGGWSVLEARQATRADVAASGSSWAKRLGIPDRRSAALLRLTPGGAPPGDRDAEAEAHPRRAESVQPLRISRA